MTTTDEGGMTSASTAAPLTLDALRAAVAGSAAAFRCRRRLQPAGGPGERIAPPTFPGAIYALDRRRIPGFDEPVTCVLLDSVQSQANRMELALQEAIDAGKIEMPLVVVDFSEYDPTGDVQADEAAGRLIEKVGRITSLQMPHRIADAIARDSQLDGHPFRRSPRGQALNNVSQNNATPLLEFCPTALIFGMWDSTGPKGGLGPKFERAIVSEIVGIDAVWERDYRARGIRRDPLGISKNIGVFSDDNRTLQRVAEGKEKGAVRPSEINHSNVPFESNNSGLTIAYAEQLTTLSLICLRRLRFPVNGTSSSNADTAAHVLLAALGLASATLAFEAGVDLRSRCVLWPETPMEWELLDMPGKSPQRFRLDAESACSLVHGAINDARSAGLPWPTEPLVLRPSTELVKLVRLSQLEAAKNPDAVADAAE
jgi:CRISPR-associated protein Csb1